MSNQSPPSRARARRVWTPEVIALVCEELRKARPLAIACRLQGHEPDSLEELMARDPEVKSMIETARSFAQAELIDEMRSAGQGEGPRVTARSWLLERLNPKAFRPPPQKVESELTGKDGGPLQMRAVPPAAARAELLAEMTKKLGLEEAERFVRLALGEPEPFEAPKEEP